MGRLGVVSGLSWSLLVHLSPSWLRAGASWGRLGVVLGLSWGVLGVLGPVLGPPRGRLGAVSGSSWGLGRLGASWGRLGLDFRSTKGSNRGIPSWITCLA